MSRAASRPARLLGVIGALGLLAVTVGQVIAAPRPSAVRPAPTLENRQPLPAEIVRRHGGIPVAGEDQALDVRSHDAREQLGRSTREILEDSVVYGPFHLLERTSDLGDGYYVNGEFRSLLRSRSEFVVKFARDTQRAATDLKTALEPGLEVTLFETIESEDMELMDVRPSRTARVAVGAELESLRANANVEYAYPVYVRPDDGGRMLPTDRILVSFGDGGRSRAFDALAQRYKLVEEIDEMSLAGDWRVFRSRIPNLIDPLAVSREINDADGVAWAEPRWVMQITLHAPPNDPFFAIQWEHQNLGLNGSLADADPDTLEAWELGYGDPNVVVAVVDSGVQLNHPDMIGNIWVNDDPAGGGDNDGNGFTDDTNGWDFLDNDNNPSPTSTGEGHGMGSAGIVAARINNGVGVSGTSNAKVMSLRITNDGSFATNTAIANAINYAWQNGAWVQSHSWGTTSSTSSSTAVDTAIANSVTSGRGGLGTPVFFATGNSASRWNTGGGPWRLYSSLLTPGTTYYTAVVVQRGNDVNGTSGRRAGADNIIHVDGTRYDFEAGLPADGFTPVLGDSAMSLMTTDAMTATLSTQSIVSPTLARNTTASYGFVPKTAVADATGEVFSQFSTYSDGTSTMAIFIVWYLGADGSYVDSAGVGAARPSTNTNAGWPASNANSIAVGSSTDWDDRSDYSQYGAQLDFLVSSNGGWHPTWSVDGTGAAGWTATDYKDFGGTSSACPKAAAIAALVLSRYPQLTATELRTVMRQTADKVYDGTKYTYDANGFNTFAGYGRLNANRAVRFAGPSDGDSDSMMFTMAGTGMQTLSSEPLEILIGVPASQRTLLLSIFDGDSGAGSGGWTGGHWDYSTQSVTYQLFADPNKTGTGMTSITSFSSASLSDNAWDLTTRQLDAAAFNAGASAYFYRLRVSPSSWTGTWANSFKIGVNGQLSVPPGTYLYQNALYTMGDLAEVYPNYVGPDNPGAPAMDTTLRMYPFYPSAPSSVTVWDADFDFGDLVWGAGATPPTVGTPDSDDPNTAPGARPPGFSGTTLDEGVQTGWVRKNTVDYLLQGVGNPPDNERRAFRQVNPSNGANVTYSVRLPGNGGTFWNMNPSGNSEWERFVVATGSDASADVQGAGATTAGFGEITVTGLDWSNIVGFHFDTEVFFSANESPYGNVVAP